MVYSPKCPPRGNRANHVDVGGAQTFELCLHQLGELLKHYSVAKLNISQSQDQDQEESQEAPKAVKQPDGCLLANCTVYQLLGFPLASHAGREPEV